MAARGKTNLRLGLVLVIGWIGAMKFTSYEAHGIEPMVAHSPVMGWMYKFLSVKPFPTCSASWRSLSPVSSPFGPKLSSIGSASAVLMFLTDPELSVLDSRLGA